MSLWRIRYEASLSLGELVNLVRAGMMLPEWPSDEQNERWRKGDAALNALAERALKAESERDAAYEDASTAEHRARLIFEDERIHMGRRAEAAEARVRELEERRLADLRTYWTHCGYPEWYGDEERAWLHAALTDAGRDADGDGDAA